jgi:hypothetical protein
MDVQQAWNSSKWWDEDKMGLGFGRLFGKSLGGNDMERMKV